MSQLMSKTEDLFVSNSCQSLKRGLNSDECFERKRFRDEDMDLESKQYYCDYRDNRDQSCDNDVEEEEEEWRQMTEFDRMLMNISNQLINFSLDLVDIPDDWPEDRYALSAETNKEMESSQHNNNNEFPPKVGQKKFGYCLDRLVSSDKRLAIFVGHKSKESDKQIIIKIGIESGFLSLLNEYNNYCKLRNVGSVVKVLDFIRWKVWNKKLMSIRWGFFVCEYFGPNLVEVMKLSNKCLISSMERVFEFAIQMIDLIECIHEKGLIHCSLKPQNFVLQNHSNSILKIIGLSDAKHYICTKSDGTVGHIEDQKDRKFHSPKGDPNFHSIGYHNGFCRSRRDDMESIGYCIVFIARGGLPWIDSNTWDEKRESFSHKIVSQIGKRMQKTSIEELCFGLPQNFANYFEVISHYKFTQKPNYEELRQCFRY